MRWSSRGSSAARVPRCRGRGADGMRPRRSPGPALRGEHPGADDHLGPEESDCRTPRIRLQADDRTTSTMAARHITDFSVAGIRAVAAQRPPVGTRAERRSESVAASRSPSRLTTIISRHGATGWIAGDRSHAGRRRSVLHDDARRHGRRGAQDRRAAARRRLARAGRRSSTAGAASSSRSIAARKASRSI